MGVRLFVYGDESGIDNTKPFTVVAGFMASVKHWDTFRAAWRRVVEEYEEREPKEFHAIYFFARKETRKGEKKKGTNPYRDWPEDKAQAYLTALLKVFADHKRVTPLGVAMDIRDFNRFSWGERAFLTGAQWNNQKKKFVSSGAPSRVYHLPFFNMIGEAVAKATPPDCKVHFVMDEQKTLAEGLAHIFANARGPTSRIRTDLKNKIGDLTWGVSHEQEGIQAADMLAHAWLGYFLKPKDLFSDRATALYTIYGIHKWEMGIIRKRGMEHVLSSEISVKGDRELIKAYPSPAERQRAKRMNQRA